MTLILPSSIFRHYDIQSGDGEKNDGPRVLGLISAYFCHRHQLLFCHRHYCPSVIDFFAVACVNAVAGVHAVAGVFAVTRVPAVAGVFAATSVPAVASVPSFSDIPAIDGISVAGFPAVNHFLSLFFHISDGMTVKYSVRSVCHRHRCLTNRDHKHLL